MIQLSIFKESIRNQQEVIHIAFFNEDACRIWLHQFPQHVLAFRQLFLNVQFFTPEIRLKVIKTDDAEF